MATTTEEIILEEILPEEIPLILSVPTSQSQFQSQHCYFDKPKRLEKDDFEYSEMVCFSSTTELISNSETGSSFYVEKTLNYGEAIIIWFLTIFSFYLIAKATFNFFWKK